MILHKPHLLNNLWIIIALLVLCVPSDCLSYSCKVLKVKDGDTIDVIHNGWKKTVRFYGIDCPESDQPYGQRAKQFVSRMCEGKTVDLIPSGENRYGRLIGLIKVNGKFLNDSLVRIGLAWVYDRYCNKRICENWNRFEQQARKFKTGQRRGW